MPTLANPRRLLAAPIGDRWPLTARGPGSSPVSNVCETAFQRRRIWVATSCRTDRDLVGMRRALESSGSSSLRSGKSMKVAEDSGVERRGEGLIVSSPRVGLRVGYLAGGFAPENRQTGASVGRSASTPKLGPNRCAHVRPCRREIAQSPPAGSRRVCSSVGTPGSIQGISSVWVKEKIISSTSWLSPTVRETGVSVVSGGIFGMKSRPVENPPEHLFHNRRSARARG